VLKELKKELRIEFPGTLSKDPVDGLA